MMTIDPDYLKNKIKGIFKEKTKVRFLFWHVDNGGVDTIIKKDIICEKELKINQDNIAYNSSVYLASLCPINDYLEKHQYMDFIPLRTPTYDVKNNVLEYCFYMDVCTHNAIFNTLENMILKPIGDLENKLRHLYLIYGYKPKNFSL